MSHASQRFYDDPRFMRGLRTVTRPIAWGAALLSGLLLVYLGGVPLFFRLGLAPRNSLPPFLDLGVLAILSFLAGIVFALPAALAAGPRRWTQAHRRTRHPRRRARAAGSNPG